MDCFGDEYTEIYDLVYHDKNYRAECDFIDAVFKRWAPRPVQHILDFGCGTGNHALEMASRGFRVTGIDRSMNMLTAALRKANARLTDPSHRPDWRTEIPASGQWDAAISMFASLNYLSGKPAVIEWLRKFREILTPGGLVLLETWNGTAVPFLSETHREKRVSAKGREITRRTEAKLDWRTQVMDVEFTFFEGAEIEPRLAELHRLCYYTPIEMSEMAQSAGLQLLDAYPAFELRRLEMKDFSVIYVLQK